MKVDLQGNVKSVGRVYLTYAKGVRGWAPVRRTVTVETDPPYRGGSGLGLLVWRGVVVTVGRWQEPLIPEHTDPWDHEALGEIDEDVAGPHEIKEWTRAGTA